MKTREEIVEAFTPKEKLSAVDKAGLLQNQSDFLDIATSVFKNVPGGSMREKALEHLLMAKFLCSQSLTHPELPHAKT